MLHGWQKASQKGICVGPERGNQKAQSSRELPQSLRVGRDCCETKVSPSCSSLCKLLWGFLWNLPWPLALALCTASKPAGVRARSAKALGATTGGVATTWAQKVMSQGVKHICLCISQGLLSSSCVQVERACKVHPLHNMALSVPTWTLHLNT